MVSPTYPSPRIKRMLEIDPNHPGIEAEKLREEAQFRIEQKRARRRDAAAIAEWEKKMEREGW